jgi:hypothetical protein
MRTSLRKVTLKVDLAKKNRLSEDISISSRSARLLVGRPLQQIFPHIAQELRL